MLYMSSGMLRSYRFGCASAWLVDVVVIVYGPGRVHRRLQRGSVGLGWSRYALGVICRCSKCQDVVFYK